MRSGFIAAAFALCLAGASGAPPARAADNASPFDILGLRLGMTADEATAALRSLDPKIGISESRLKFTFTDGVKSHSTEPFLYYINAGSHIADGAGRSRRWSRSLRVYFSPPPKGGRVTAVVRVQTGMPNAPSGAQYLDALVKKYGGKPDFSQLGIHRWDFPDGKTQCVNQPRNALQAGSGESIGSSLARSLFVFKGRARTDTLQNRKVKYLSQCASFVQYQIGNYKSSVTNVRAELVDVVGIAEAEIAANEWVAGLAAKAREARESKVKGPKL